MSEVEAVSHLIIEPVTSIPQNEADHFLHTLIWTTNKRLSVNIHRKPKWLTDKTRQEQLQTDLQQGGILFYFFKLNDKLDCTQTKLGVAVMWECHCTANMTFDPNQ